MDLELHSLKALVTGSSRGLGYAIARHLALEGCQVTINSRDGARLGTAAGNLARESGATIHRCVSDVSTVEGAAFAIKRSASLMSGLDLLVTNTGGPPSGLFENIDDETWLHAVDLALMSHVRLIRNSLPWLRASSHASVLTLTSYSVKQPIPNLVLSNSIRSAVIGLTKSLALELGKDGIRFNSILPAWTETERVDELMEARAKLKQTMKEDEILHQAAESPFQRMAVPDEIGKPAVFLLSPAASYITGVMLSVDGGMVKGTW